MSSTAALAAIIFAGLQVLGAGLALHSVASAGLARSADLVAERSSGVVSRHDQVAASAR